MVKGSGGMKRLRCLILVVVCAGFAVAASQEVSSGATDSTKAKAVVQESVKKQVSVPKPKTNWSKIKDLFM